MRLLSLIAAIAAIGCATEPSPTPPPSPSDDDSGELSLALVGQAPSGATYRLRHAELTIAGAVTTVVFHSDDYLDQPSFSAHLPTGPYTLSLAPGWSLERRDPDGTLREVPASLASANPLSFDVTSGAFTPVALRFLAASERVDLGHGDVGVSVSIDDSAGNGVEAIIADAPSVRVGEGSTATFDIRLASRPATDVVVFVASDDANAATVATPVIVFHASDWFAPHAITVIGSQDDDLLPAAATLSLTSSTVSGIRIPLTVDDDDAQEIGVDTYTLWLAEGGSAELSVWLRRRPATAQTVTLTTGLPRTVVVEPSTLTFTPDEHATPQRVIVRVAPDSLRSSIVSDLQLTVAPAPRAANTRVVLQISDQLFPVTRGFPTSSDRTETIAADRIIAQPLDLTDLDSILQSLQLIASAGGNARMALHLDAGNGEPDYAMSPTWVGPFAPQGLHEPTRAEPEDTSISLPAGRYWITVRFDRATEVGISDDTTTRCQLDWPFDLAPPNGSWTCAADQPALSLAAIVRR